MANEYRTCPGCGRSIPASLVETAGAHAPGCPKRRSLKMKAAFERRAKRKLAAAKAAETRRQRRAAAPAVETAEEQSGRLGREAARDLGRILGSMLGSSGIYRDPAAGARAERIAELDVYGEN